MISIPKVAEIVGISKVALYKRIAKGEFIEYITKENGTNYINDEGLEKIKDLYKNKPSSKPYSKLGGKPELSQVNVYHDIIEDLKKQLDEKHEYIKMFQNELENKDRQLESKDSQLIAKDIQISELNKSIHQEQELNARNQLLLESTNNKMLMLESKSKKSLWSKLF